MHQRIPLSDIKYEVGNKIYQRGMNYYEEKRVEEIIEDEDYLSAKVKGSGNKIYYVSIHLLGDDYDYGECTCPYPHDCKHIAAVLIQYSLYGSDGIKEIDNPIKEKEKYDSDSREEIIDFKDTMNYYDSYLITDIKNLEIKEARKKDKWRLIFIIEFDSNYVYSHNKNMCYLSAGMQFIKKSDDPGRISFNCNFEKISVPLNDIEEILKNCLENSYNNKIILTAYIDLIIKNNSKLNIYYRINNKLKPVKFISMNKFSLDFQLTELSEKKKPVFLPFFTCESSENKEKYELDVRENFFKTENTIYLMSQNGNLFYKNISKHTYLIIEKIFYKQKIEYNEILFLKKYIYENLKNELGFSFNKTSFKIINIFPEVIIELLQLSDKITGLNIIFKYREYEFKFNLETEVNIFNLKSNDEIMLFTYRNIDFEHDVYKFVKSIISRYALTNYIQNDEDICNFRLKMTLKKFIINYGIKLIDEGYELKLENKSSISKSSGKLTMKVTSEIDWLDIKTDYLDEDGNLHKIDFSSSDIDSGLIFINNNFVVLTKEEIMKLKLLEDEGIDKDGITKISKNNFDVIDELYESIKNKNNEDIKNIRNIYEKLKNFKKIKNVALPRNFFTKLRNYQKSGYNWLHFLHQYQLNGCLADDMGLGKTVQTLCFLQKLKEDNLPHKSLIIVPVTTIANWESEIIRFTPQLIFTRHFGQDRVRDLDHLEKYDIIIISYHTLLRDIDIIKDIKFDFIILDEAQYIKNSNTKIAKAVKLLDSKNRLSLTGTPVENNTYELWSQMNFLNPGLLGNINKFTQKYAKPIERDNDKAAAESLRKKIFPFILRRKKEDVLDDLPEKEIIIQYVDMKKDQKELYNKQKEYYKDYIDKTLNEKGVNKSVFQILEALLRLRQISIFPELMDKKYKKFGSSKFDFLKNMIDEVLCENHKTLIFSQFVQSLEIIKQYLDENRIRYSMITGKTKNREKQINNFQNKDDVKFFLISLKAGAFGINLTAADYVVLFDPWWNPAVESQAIDRAHRIGQTKNIMVYKLIVKDTIEEKILKLQESKKKLVEDIISSESNFFKSLNKEDIMDLFD